jgi:polyhydroxyalkanoate synthesis regulator phasin
MLGGMSNISGAFADASAAGYNYKNAVDSVRDGTMTSEEAREQLNDQILQEQARQMEQTTGIFDKTIGIQEDLRTLTTTVMETTIPHIENVAVAALDKISEVMPSAETIANELAGGINNLFNAAEFMDTNTKVIKSGHGNIVDRLMENANRSTADAEALGATTTATGEATDATIEGTATTTQNDVEAARAEVAEANAALDTSVAQLATLTEQGLNALDPPVRAAQEAAEAARARIAEAETNLSDTIINSIDGLRAIQNETLGKIASFRAGGPIRGFAKGGEIGANELAMVGEAGPEFISGPANVMSANTSMGVMQNLMKGIKSLDSSVQNSGVNGQNTISNSNVAEQMSNLMASKFDTMIQQLQTLVTIESSSVSAQQKTFRATKSLQGNMLKGTI